MAKKQKETVEKTTTNVRSYFTKEINERITEMSTKEMESILRELIDTEAWIAILKYTGMRTPLLDATMRGTDPVAEPSKISWAQGAMAGLSDLETYVIDLNSTPKADNPPQEDEDPDIRPEGIVG